MKPDLDLSKLTLLGSITSPNVNGVHNYSFSSTDYGSNKELLIFASITGGGSYDSTGPQNTVEDAEGCVFIPFIEGVTVGSGGLIFGLLEDVQENITLSIRHKMHSASTNLVEIYGFNT